MSLAHALLLTEQDMSKNSRFATLNRRLEVNNKEVKKMITQNISTQIKINWKAILDDIQTWNIEDGATNSEIVQYLNDNEEDYITTVLL